VILTLLSTLCGRQIAAHTSEQIAHTTNILQLFLPQAKIDLHFEF